MMPMVEYRLTRVPAAIAVMVALGVATATAPSQTEVPAELAKKMDKAKDEAKKKDKPEFPKFEDVAKDYKKVISTVDGKSLYTLYTRKKDGQVLAELPSGFANQKLFIAYNIAGGSLFAGIQVNDQYAYWKRFDKKLALIEPNFAVRTSGDLESQKGLARVFTDRVLLEVPIECMGPGGGPVIDMDALLVGQASKFFGRRLRGFNKGLINITKAKAFPENVELAFEVPDKSGRLVTLRYSISLLPEKTGYTVRKADARVGYFTTTHLDLAKPGEYDPYVRYINRWNLEKADPKLKLSPPKRPIVFYLEHTVPVRYRRWVREGLLEWNKAFEKIGVINAIEVYQQDARTKAHMDKDPEDVRYNFLLWTNAPIGFAIGPSRVDPRTGQILDADIVMSEAFIRSWARAWREMIPEIAIEGFGPETLTWLAEHPNWDPRVRLAPLIERRQVMERIARQAANGAVHPAQTADPTLLGDEAFDGLSDRISQVNGACMYTQMRTLDLAMFRLHRDFFTELARGDNGPGEEDEEEGDLLDGVPESFIGPLLKDVIMHEVGHTLGLRHNFKASTIHSIQEINTEEFKGRPQTGSVMDYNPINVNFDDGPVQGDWTMVTIGPYDEWAIQYGYSLEKDLKPILARVSEGTLPYATDEDTWGPDPLARRFDYGSDPLDFADSQMRLIAHLRKDILERVVKEGDSWQKARNAYLLLLHRHIGAVSIAANWLGGSYVNRDRKGDPGDRDPVITVPAAKQRRALKFVIDNAFSDEAFGLTPELLAKMTVDKWWDPGGRHLIFEDPSWPVHDRIIAIQAAAITMIMNPTTLRRVFDNEFRLPSNEDAFTLPEIIHGVTDSIWSELDNTYNGTYTVRQPMISSLRRNLQAEHLERLIDLTMTDTWFGASARPISNLSLFKLRQLNGKIQETLDQAGYRIDLYSLAHLTEAKVLIEEVLNAQYIRNLDDIRIRMTLPSFFFEPQGGEDPDH
ncbi:MAG: zinc-dependent metalloprotease [Planctomycetes bacterium]|nr:zinc-dependent metalloprotease [Planctomycetota bacterium]